MDDYAKKQDSPKKNVQMTNIMVRDSMGSTFNQPTRSIPYPSHASRQGAGAGAGGACEWDRLMQERNELLQSGTYTTNDPLIKELDRQITAS